MYTSNLRKVGGSVMLAVPTAILDMLQLRAGSAVRLAVADDSLVMTPAKKKNYTLDELLAQCDRRAAVSDEDQTWVTSPAIGQELI
ncbi:MAG: antitoxin [Desulfovibrionaceae bacterium]|nr:antitoxin [Desulfovibrionaceae bacterium]